MSTRGAVLLAIGMLVLGLALGALGGGITGFVMGQGSRAAAFNRNFQNLPFQQQQPNQGQQGQPQLPNQGQQGQQQQPNQTNPRGGLRQQPTTSGAAQVTQVEQNSPASKAGLQENDVITAVGGTKLDATHTLADLIQAKKPGDKVDLAVTRGTQSLTITVELGASTQDKNAAFLGVRYAQTAPSSEQFRQPGKQNSN
jgi:membrane-associated protease RseP (regulator of RpoE activity)